MLAAVDEGDTDTLALDSILDDEVDGAIFGIVTDRDGIEDEISADVIGDADNDNIGVNADGVDTSNVIIIEYILTNLYILTILNYYSECFSKVISITVVDISFNPITPWCHSSTVILYLQCLCYTCCIAL